MCKHNKNYQIVEIMNASHARTACDGKPDEVDHLGRPIGYNEMEDIQYYIFRCNDCPVTRKFRSLGVERPVFIKNAIDVLFP